MLSQDVERHIDLQRSLGFKYRTQAYLLRSFAACVQTSGEEFIRAERVVQWASEAPSLQQRRNRLLTVRRLALTLRAEESRHEIPPPNPFGRAGFRRIAPHVYTPEEICRLMHAAMQLAPAGSIRGLTYATLIGLVAATGIRVSEALRLELSDVSPDGLVIRETKFRKSRLLPLHDSTGKALTQYMERRYKLHSTAVTVFVSSQGRCLSYSTTNAVFRCLLRSVGITARGERRAARLHDLRHYAEFRTMPSRAASALGSMSR
jgi:integrase